MDTYSIQKELSPHALSSYPKASMRELFSLSFPLMLSFLSGSLMIFINRLMLAHYSTEAMNASVSGSTLSAVLQYSSIAIASISEVYVGQYNGARQYEKIGAAVWQMIWFSLLTSFLFVPLGLFAGPYLFSGILNPGLANDFFKVAMLFGPVFPLIGALSGFFIGRGRVKPVTLSTIFANLLNIVLAKYLIFGVEGIMSPLGVKGAALAAGISQAFQALILFCLFLHPKNQKMYGTLAMQYQRDVFFGSLKIGAPNAFAHTIEIMGWATFTLMMSSIGFLYMTVVSIAQSIFFLFTFFIEGLCKAVIAIASNLIGSSESHLMWKLFGSALKVHSLVFIALSLVLVIFPDNLIHLFLSDDLLEKNPELTQLIRISCFWIWIFFLFDGIVWMIVGLLTASQDTKFIMVTGGTTVWGFAILPIYIFVVKLGGGAELIWQITAGYGIFNSLIYFLRFRLEKWRNATLISH